MYTHPWVLQEMGIERSLAELRDCGLDAIQLSFSYHVASFLMPRHPHERLRTGIPGVLHFQPSPSVLRHWPLVPPVAPQVTGTTYVTETLEKIHAAGLRTLAWVVFLYNHSLAGSSPGAAVVNAFGDRHPAQLCCSNPAVRRYALGLTEEVVQHAPLTGFVAESLTFLPFDYGALNLKAAVTPPPPLSRLLSLCFCEHCRTAAENADVDTELLGRAVVREVDRMLEGLPGSPTDNGMLDWRLSGEELEVYEVFHAARVEQVVSLQTEVLNLARSYGLRPATTAGEGQDEYITAAPAERLREVRAEYRFELFAEMDDHAIEEATAQALAQAGSDPAYALVQLIHFATKAELARVLSKVRELGVSRFRFYEYGTLSSQQIQWLYDLQEIWRVREG